MKDSEFIFFYASCNLKPIYLADSMEAYLEPSQTSEMEFLAKIVNGFQLRCFSKKFYHRCSSGFQIRFCSIKKKSLDKCQ